MTDNKSNLKRSRDFCLTLLSEEAFQLFKETPARYKVAGKFLSPVSGDIQWSAYIFYEHAKSFQSVKKYWGNCCCTRRKSQTPKIASQFCKKGLQSLDEWNQLGVKGPNYGLNATIWEEGTIPTRGRLSSTAPVKASKLQYPTETMLPWDGTLLEKVTIIKRKGKKYLEFTVGESKWIEKGRCRINKYHIIENNCLIDQLKPSFGLPQTGCHYFNCYTRWYYVSKVPEKELPKYPNFKGAVLTEELTDQVKKWLIFSLLFNLAPRLELQEDRIIMPYHVIIYDENYFAISKADKKRWFSSSSKPLLPTSYLWEQDVTSLIIRLTANIYPTGSLIHHLYLYNRSLFSREKIGTSSDTE